MYLTFYGVNEKPFATTPDPRFLYLTPGHREALAHLIYGVQENMGFLVLTGEVGTGKTTLLHALRQRLEGNVAVAFIVNSGLSFDGILEYMLEDFGIHKVEASRAQRLVTLQRFLIERVRAGENVVFILDEAHHLDPVTLEHIRLLSNFESPTQKLLQIVLVGQPELKVKLDLPELRQLKQRIALRAVIPALSPQEIREYIRRRLSIAGARDLGLFTDRAVSRIAEYAQGIPRTVNIVCDHCLVIGYADQKQRVDVDVVKQAIRYLEDGARPSTALARLPRRGWWRRRRFASDKASVQLDDGPTETAPVTPVLVSLEHHSPAGGGRERGLLRRQALAAGLALVAFGGLVLVGAEARRSRQQRDAPPTATVVAPRQPDRLKAAVVPPSESQAPRPTVDRPDQPERPQAGVVSPSQPGLPRATVAEPPRPEGPKPPIVRHTRRMTVDRPRQPEVPQAAVVMPGQPPVGNDTIERPVSRSASMSEPNADVLQERANRSEPPREPTGSSSNSERVQRFLRTLSPSDLGGKE